MSFPRDTDAPSIPTDRPAPEPTSDVRALSGGFLTGLANLVPGLSGGTMVLILGLYETLIRAIASVTALKLDARTLRFLAAFGLGGVLAIAGLSKVAMWSVVNHRMLAFALFVGLTLGVVPELLKLCGKVRPATVVAAVLGFGVVVGLEVADVSSLEANPLTLGLVGALAAASMILPGLSGSYVLLIFGMYEVVIGSLSLLSEAPKEALGVLIPVGLGALAGVALLSNVLKFLLSRYSGPTHAALLGLVFGSVVGLWPFQALTHQDLADRATRKGIEAIVVDELEMSAVAKEFGPQWTAGRIEEVRGAYAGKTRGELKIMSKESERFPPGGGQIAAVLGMAVLGFGLTRVLSRA